jgi:hypothetical protein
VKTLVVSIIIACAALIALMVHWSNEYERACEARGGHTVTHTGTGVGVSSSGKPGVVTTSTTNCYTSDGRRIEL